MSDAAATANAIRLHLLIGTLKSGSLRIWGDWFGRPYDNCHRIVSVEATDAVSRLIFDQSEVLTVRDPRDSTISSDAFRIESASQVRWEWFYYGRPQTPANRFFLNYERNGTSLRCST